MPRVFDEHIPLAAYRCKGESCKHRCKQPHDQVKCPRCGGESVSWENHKEVLKALAPEAGKRRGYQDA